MSVKLCRCSYDFFAIMQALRIADETPSQYREHEVPVTAGLLRPLLIDFYKDCLKKPLSSEELEAMTQEINADPIKFHHKLANIVYECKEGR